MQYLCLRTFVLLALLTGFAFHGFGQSKLEKRVGEVKSDPGPSCDTTAWRLVFSDEFDGKELDRTKWRTWFPYSDDGSDRASGTRIMGTSNTIFRDDLVTVDGGLLHLGVRAKAGEWYGQAKEHEGSMIHSMDNGKFTYGRFEVRCRIPRGAGLWPAFWGFGGESEIDVFEFCGEKTRFFKGALHRWGSPRFDNSGKKKMDDLSRDFHVYAVEWERDGISWFIDDELVQYRGRFVDKRGKPLARCDREAGEHATAPYYPRSEDGVNIILNLAVSESKGFCKGPRKPEPWPEGSEFVVDYLRVYQRKESATVR